MERVILNVDTGLDDAVALFLAAGLDEISIEAVVATAGNVGLEKTVENTLNILESAGVKAPVYRGSKGPLVRSQIIAGEFHGETGLDGPTFGPRKFQQALDEDGIDAMIRLVHENPGQLSLVCVGPLTDLAVALKRDLEVATLAKQVIIMGGSFSQGNVTEHAEFNTYADPEAAAIVFASKAKMVLFALDCTRQVTLSREQLAGYHAKPGKNTRIFCACMDTYTGKYAEKGLGDPQIHDPLCIAYLVDPSKVETEPCTVTVDINPTAPTYGRTTKTPSSEGVLVARTIDKSWFWSLVDRALERLD